MPRSVSELEKHARFLTGKESEGLKGESAIFNQNPLNKKPGANYTWDELCGLEIIQMDDNAYEFDKKILYQ